MDRVRIDKITCYGYHGALPEENRLGQHYEASIEMELDLKGAGESDDLSQTIDYRRIVAVAEEVLTGPACKLIEALAERIAQKALAAIPTARAVTVEVTKPRPPVPHNLTAVSVIVRRER